MWKRRLNKQRIVNLSIPFSRTHHHPFGVKKMKYKVLKMIKVLDRHNIKIQRRQYLRGTTYTKESPYPSVGKAKLTLQGSFTVPRKQEMRDVCVEWCCELV